MERDISKELSERLNKIEEKIEAINKWIEQEQIGLIDIKKDMEELRNLSKQLKEKDRELEEKEEAIVNTKEVIEIYSFGYKPFESDKGYYKVILRQPTKEYVKIFSSEEHIQASNIALVIEGFIEAIKKLKKGYNIELYSVTSIGLSNINKSKNKELLAQMIEEIDKGNHAYKFKCVTKEYMKNIKKIANENYKGMIE